MIGAEGVDRDKHDRGIPERETPVLPAARGPQCQAESRKGQRENPSSLRLC